MSATPRLLTDAEVALAAATEQKIDLLKELGIHASVDRSNFWGTSTGRVIVDPDELLRMLGARRPA